MTDITSHFESLLARSDSGKYVLRLYVAGTTPQSTRAIANLRQICDEHLSGRYELLVVDLFERPEDARLEQIVAAPTLVKLQPGPLRRLLGDLSNTNRVLLALDLPQSPS